MVTVIIFCSFIVYEINKALVKLERKQEVLCYDMYLLRAELHEEELLLLK